MLWEIRQIQEKKKEEGNKNEGNFNGQYFIKMNTLYSSFDASIESLCQTVVAFWRALDRPTLDVLTTKSLGSQIAKGIKTLFNVFKELDQLKVSKDYNMYFKFAIA